MQISKQSFAALAAAGLFWRLSASTPPPPPKNDPVQDSVTRGVHWLVSVQGKDAASIAQLSGRIASMTIARVGYSLSKETREKVEADVTAQAIAQWRIKAQQMSQQFGYSGYVVREISVATNEPGGGMQPMTMARARVSSAADESLPTEAGKGEVGATVSGSAQMTR